MSVRKGEKHLQVFQKEKLIELSSHSAEKREKPEEPRRTAAGRCCLPRLEGNGGQVLAPCIGVRPWDGA